MSVLLAMPRQKGSYTSINIAETVSDVLAEFDLCNSKLGNLVTDNPSNNETCLAHLSKEHGLNWRKRWIRCSDHVLNLGAVMFGSAITVPLKQSSSPGNENGLIGKLHNVVY